MKGLLFVFVACAFLALTSTAMAGVITLQPGPEGKDTWIWDTEDFSHGNWGEMRVNDVSTYNQYSLVEFDLSAVPTSSITSATLGLYRYGGLDASGLTVDTHSILSPWTEDVTWSTQPSFNAAVESSATIYGNGWYTWNLTSLTQSWLNSTIDNYGVALYDHGSSRYQRFVTSDNSIATDPSWALPPTDASLRPYLRIEYGGGPAVPEPASLSLLGFGLLGLLGLKRKK